MNFINHKVNHNSFNSQSQPFTQSQEGYSDYIHRHSLSQFSQTSEMNSYTNMSAIHYGEFQRQDNNSNINTYVQDNSSFTEGTFTNSISTTNHFNLRFADL